VSKRLCWDVDIPDTPVQELPAPTAARINAVAVSPSGRFVATAADDASVTIYALMPLSTHLATQGVTPVGGYVVSRKALEGHTGRVLGLAWAPDEKQLISVGDDSCIAVHNFYGGGVDGDVGDAPAGGVGAMDAGEIAETTPRDSHMQHAHAHRPGGIPQLALR
jgi:WD40 repeat protein